MANVFVIGAAGKVGRRLVALLAEQGHGVGALHRKPEQAASLNDAGARAIEGDITTLDADTLAGLAQPYDTIVFTAGAGGAGVEVTNAVDGRGMELAIEAARIAGVRRLILVSAFPEASRDKQTSDSLENYLRVKKRAEARLVATPLDWVILRPGMLLDEAGTGRVHADVALENAPVSRDDVAAILAAIVARTDLRHIIIELTQGDTLISDALDRLARQA